MSESVYYSIIHAILITVFLRLYIELDGMAYWITFVILVFVLSLLRPR